MSKPPFQLGDVVRMRSGGPAMTVEEVKPDRTPPQVCCMWFAARGRPHIHYFRADILELAAPEEVSAATGGSPP